ncbi:hypothetical protein PoB_002648400 [Plakobranchus ocellatus]|uniref:Peptidase S1 domain-containing protein n=1 Tax=Plakobranchus ocellatus TaxID=259542 RepID=A0AAV4A065_9GAST|nr:hypothetical protein PoB_002648400 [Plakobranchus ocellatus]
MGSGPEAAESDNSWGKCMKHPGHANFIPISEFCLESLPKQYQSQNTVDVVKAIADLTVKLVVRHNTADRMTYSMFCYSMSGDTSAVHVGSGWVMDIEEGYGSCPGCSDCTPSSPQTMAKEQLCNRNSPPCAPITPSCGRSSPPSCTSTSASIVQEPLKIKEKWFDIYVATAKHVVFNPDEAQATEVQIFYDDRESRKNKRMKSIYGRKTGLGSSHDDFCIVICRTHNESLANELKVCLERMRNMMVKKNRDDIVDQPKGVFPPDYPNNLCIMVSHPHGQPKMVTLGKTSEILYGSSAKKVCGDRGRQALLKNALHYNTKSCPGSSGAPVFMPTCIETRQKSCNGYNFVDALVIRPHSIGNVLGPVQSIGLSAGALPLQYFPLLCLPSSSDIPTVTETPDSFQNSTWNSPFLSQNP